jgi:hypothetical protein
LKDFQDFPPWPLQKQLIVDWKMPHELQCVMLFDKLEYFLENADNHN